MSFSYSATKHALDEIASRITANNKRGEQARATLATAVADLNAMTAAYGPIITALNTELASDPDNAALQAMSAEAAALVAEYQARKTALTAKLAALDAG